MQNTTSLRITFSLLGLAFALAPLAASAEVRSISKEIVVMQPADLPAQAQLPGNSFFLHTDNAGSSYLYVEQQQGAHLSVFDVTDPAHIRTISSTALTVPGAFDFVRPLDGTGELIRFRDGGGLAVLDVRNARKPTLRLVESLANLGVMQPLGESGFLAVNDPDEYVGTSPRDFEVVDISKPSTPKLLTTVKQVRHRLVNDATGTTFLLGSDGLTVVRRLSIETDYKAHQMQMQGN